MEPYFSLGFLARATGKELRRVPFESWEPEFSHWQAGWFFADEMFSGEV